MVDYGINGDFDLKFTDEDKLEAVTGFDEFEDDLAIALEYEVTPLIGEYNDSAALKERAKLIVTRLARESDVIDGLKSINVFETPRKQTNFSLEITYHSGENFQETI